VLIVLHDLNFTELGPIQSDLWVIDFKH